MGQAPKLIDNQPPISEREMRRRESVVAQNYRSMYDALDDLEAGHTAFVHISASPGLGKSDAAEARFAEGARKRRAEWEALSDTQKTSQMKRWTGDWNVTLNEYTFVNRYRVCPVSIKPPAFFRWLESVSGEREFGLIDDSYSLYREAENQALILQALSGNHLVQRENERFSGQFFFRGGICLIDNNDPETLEGRVKGFANHLAADDRATRVVFSRYYADLCEWLDLTAFPDSYIEHGTVDPEWLIHDPKRANALEARAGAFRFLSRPLDHPDTSKRGLGFKGSVAEAAAIMDDVQRWFLAYSDDAWKQMRVPSYRTLEKVVKQRALRPDRWIESCEQLLIPRTWVEK